MPSWAHVVKEIAVEKDDPPGGDSATDKVRKKYLMQLHNKVKRHVICYYSGWLSKPRNLEGLEINDEDKNGFMLCAHKLDKSIKGCDLFLHTPGGSGAATESIVNYLKQIFGNDIRAFVPQLAMSAGTIIACACKEIYMGKHSNLGPVDPQINGIPAYAVLDEIERAYTEMRDPTKPQRQFVWGPILSRYTPGFVEQCHWAIEKSKTMVSQFLKENMFATLPEGERNAKTDKVVDGLTKSSANQGHDAHFHYEKCKELGLEVRLLEDGDKELQDLVLTVHHCMMVSLSNTPVTKIIEYHTGKRWLKMIQNQINLPQIVFPPNVFRPPGVPT